MTSKYKVMIIDDSLRTREPKYRKVFDEGSFEPLFVGTAAQLNDYADTPVDGYVLDVFLNTGDWSNTNASQVLEKHIVNAPRRAPVFLVSEGWGNPTILDHLKRALDHAPDLVRQYLAWTEFDHAVPQPEDKYGADRALLLALRKKILDELDIWHRRSKVRLNPNDTVRVLLLSDLQYNDPATAGDTPFFEIAVASTLKKERKIPHFVVIAGDLSFSGAPKDFEVAHERLESDLMATLWGKSGIDAMRERMILVPGNHDVNLRFSACDGYDFSLADKILRTTRTRAAAGAPEAAHGATMESRQYGMHHDYALLPFLQFAEGLTRDRRWRMAPNLDWVDRRFEHWGVRLFCLNSVAHLSASDPKRAAFDLDKSLRAIARSIDETVQGEFFNIVISHHGVKISDASKEQIENWPAVERDFFRMQRMQLWFCGHYHQFRRHQIYPRMGECPSLWLVQAPTGRIRSNSSRGFCLIELSREDGKVKDAHVIQYKVTPDVTERSDPYRVFGGGE